MEGSIEKRGSRIYRLKVHLGYNGEGRRLSKSSTIHGTRREAQARLKVLLAEYEQLAPQTGAFMTVSGFLDYWLENYAANLAKRTAENYREYVSNYIKPYIGDIRLDQLTRQNVQEFYKDLGQRGTRRNNQVGLSPTTVFNTSRVLKGALNRAVEWKYIGNNPALGVKTPQLVEREHRILTVEELTMVLAASKDTQIYLPVMLLWSLGLRRGEVCGLRWQDLDLDRSIAGIRHTLIRVSPGNLVFKAPKTKSGRRSVKLSSVLVSALREHRAQQLTYAEVLGSSYNPMNLVICRADGRPVDPATIYSQFQRLLERLKIPRVALHDLRHTHATQLLQQGVNIKVIAERLGHADPAITLRVYAHVIESMQEEAADLTNDLLIQATKTSTDL
ncbi:MAG: tyrosine-type recombinase/integrase [Chthonomonadales bacterium]